VWPKSFLVSRPLPSILVHQASIMASKEKGRNVKKMLAVDQRRRQNLALDRQKTERRGRINLARMMGGESEAAAPDDNTENAAAAHEQGADAMGDPAQNESPAEGKGRGRRGRRSVDPGEEAWKGALMVPDWMIETPDALPTEWLVTSRPEGYFPDPASRIQRPALHLGARPDNLTPTPAAPHPRKRCLVMASRGSTTARLRS